MRFSTLGVFFINQTYLGPGVDSYSPRYSLRQSANLANSLKPRKFGEITEGQKSRDTVPLNKTIQCNFEIITFKLHFS
jgi:hypothetical protein